MIHLNVISRYSVIASSAPLKSTKIVKIIWFVSNCDSASKREDFVKMLSQQENIQVDIYGACGTLKCSRKSADFCFQTLLPKYDFYLSLENEVCPDYVTEKLCKIFKHNIVPVVLGGADYSQMAPPHSVINVADFKDVNDLSKYLRLIADNPEEYNRYFEWKKTHFIEQRIQPFFACDICSKLNQPDHVKPVKLSDWWNQRKCLDSWKDLMTI
jgi:alpha-1,3-fucosyltransferase